MFFLFRSRIIFVCLDVTVELPYVAKKVFYHGYHQNQSTPIKFEVVDGRTRFKGCKGRCFFTAEK